MRERARDFYVNSLLGSKRVWRYGLNAHRTASFAFRKAPLSDEAARVVADLVRDGAALSTLDALTGDPTVFQQLKAEATALEQAKADVLREREKQLADIDDLGSGYDKLFVVAMLDESCPTVDPDGILARVALHPRIKAIADHYYGMRTRVSDINIWRNLPTGKEPVASQLWHRDLPEDHLILKMFIYLEDVEPGAGPFTYVKGTHGYGDREWNPDGTFHDGSNVRADDSSMDAAVPADRRPSFPGPAGTVLFGDTIGWHRGGHAVTSSRFVLQVLYSSFAAMPYHKLGAPDAAKAPFPRDLVYARNLSTPESDQAAASRRAN